MYDSTYEMTDFDNHSPVRFFIHTIGSVPLHWHQCLELLYISDGTVTVTVKNTSFRLKEDDLILFHPYEVHALTASHCVIAAFQIQLNLFDKHVLPPSLRFDCCSVSDGRPERFDALKHLLAALIQANTEPDSCTPILNKSLSYALLHELVSSFGVEEYVEESDHSQTLSRMEEILDFINANYARKLSLALLAEEFFLTVPYLSRIFKKYIGINFSEYLTKLRLAHGVNDLLETEASIEQIAEQNGFPNSRSFVTAFKEEYAMLPSVYRREQKQPQRLLPQKSAREVSNYILFEQHNYLGRLAEYLDLPGTAPAQNGPGLQKIDAAPININQKGTPLRHTFRTFTSIGKAKQLLFAQNQEMLKCLQADIGFRYIKFHGLLDDDMMVYSEGPDGSMELSFAYLDMAFDFLLSIRLKPLVELSFMPKALAKTPERTLFFRESIISLPKDLSRWEALILALLRHFEARYGRKEMESWLFCLWNEPDSPSTMFGFEDAEAFFSFYKATYDTVKGFDSNICFGSPSMLYDTLVNGEWLPRFMDFANTQNCPPDFLHFHFYPISLESTSIPNLPQHEHLILDRNENLLRDTISRIRKNIRARGLFVPRLYLTEWNSSVSHRDLLNDTAFKAAYIVKNILENYDRLDSFGYWLSTDLLEEVKISNQVFHGGLGLFTYNGIKKAAYYGFSLLARLGDAMLGRGNGYFVTKGRDGVQILLYNYQHYSSLYASGELFDMTFTNRYTPFLNGKIKKFTIPLTGLTDGPWTVTETIVNRESGSSFDNWVAFGALPLKTEREIDYLKSISLPKILKRQITVADHMFPITAELAPHEVRLVELTPGPA